jgi:hypothetical protein
MIMIRTQIQLTPEQARALKRLAAKEGKSVAEIIRISVNNLLGSGGIKDEYALRQKAKAVIGVLHGPVDLAENHDSYFVEASDQ